MGLLIIIGDLAEFLMGDENYNLDEPDEEDINVYKEIYQFPSPLVASEEDDVLGNIVGSSYGLLRELIELAPAIDIQLNNGDISEDTIDNLINRRRYEHPLETERSVWFSLFEAARNSINYNTAIRFG